MGDPAGRGLSVLCVERQMVREKLIFVDEFAAELGGFVDAEGMIGVVWLEVILVLVLC